MSRKNARIGQMQVLYQMDLVDDYSVESLNEFLGNFSFKKAGEKEEVYFNKEEVQYIKNTVPVAVENLDTIDKYIDSHLQGWTINRLSKVDKSILRIAVYEFIFSDIPASVSINEAVEIAKVYAGENSPKFINGILGSIYKTLELDK